MTDSSIIRQDFGINFNCTANVLEVNFIIWL